jgi:hypothetical protein
MKSPKWNSHDSLILLKNIEESSGKTTKANKINDTFLRTRMSNFAPLSRDFTNKLVNNFTENQSNELLSVSTEEVRMKLANLNPQKAQGRDSIPGWQLAIKRKCRFACVSMQFPTF